MSDLIERSKAIDAIKKDRDASDMPKMWYQGVDYAINHLIHLPSAQPDVPDKNVVRCKDCRYYSDVDEHEHWCNGWGWPARLITPFDYCSKGVRR